MSNDLITGTAAFEGLSRKQLQDIAQYASYCICVYLQEKAHPRVDLQDNREYLHWVAAFENITKLIRGMTLEELSTEKEKS